MLNHALEDAVDVGVSGRRVAPHRLQRHGLDDDGGGQDGTRSEVDRGAPAVCHGVLGAVDDAKGRPRLRRRRPAAQIREEAPLLGGVGQHLQQRGREDGLHTVGVGAQAEALLQGGLARGAREHHNGREFAECGPYGGEGHVRVAIRQLIIEQDEVERVFVSLAGGERLGRRSHQLDERVGAGRPRLGPEKHPTPYPSVRGVVRGPAKVWIWARVRKCRATNRRACLMRSSKANCWN